MKKLIEEVPEEGLIRLMGKTVIMLCMNYFYTGKLVGVNDKEILLEDASIVYDTGKWTDVGWQAAQKMGGDVYVQLGTVEAYMEVK